jgi:hypothetical protein
LWWSKRGVINASPAQDGAVALQGQAKHIARQAYEELEASLASIGGAGEAVTALVTSEWFANTAKDSAPCQLGQLKTLGAPFYDRLRQLNIDPGNGLTGGKLYPWTGATEDDADMAPAAIGQLKQVFSFDLDKDEDGLPDWWEARAFGTMNETAATDYDGDGLSNGQELGAGTAAHLADTDRDGQRDGVDGNPNRFDKPAPVYRQNGLQVHTRFMPADRVIGGQNKARGKLGLPATEKGLRGPGKQERLNKEKGRSEDRPEKTAKS